MNWFKSLFSKKPKELFKRKLPEGWIEIKVSDNLYFTHIPAEQQEKWTKQRIKKDRVENLINKDGFHLKSYGRAGTVYYIENGKMCEIDYEISGVPEYDLLFSFEEINSWFFPQIPITADEKNIIRAKFVDWLKTKKIKGQL